MYGGVSLIVEDGELQKVLEASESLEGEPNQISFINLV